MPTPLRSGELKLPALSCAARWRFSAKRQSARKGLGNRLRRPCDTKHDLPFVITTETTAEHAMREAVAEMSKLDFLNEPPLALPLEPPL